MKSISNVSVDNLLQVAGFCLQSVLNLLQLTLFELDSLSFPDSCGALVD